MTNERKGPAPGRVAERRTNPRYGFTADAEVIEDGSGTRIEARITDIGQRGCYVETPRSFPLGTAIRVQVIQGNSVRSFGAVDVDRFTAETKQPNSGSAVPNSPALFRD